MSRSRVWMVLLFAAAFHTGAAVRAQDARPARPNVVLIVADDLGYADVGCQGLSKDVKTPNLDAIAAGGVRFTNGYVSGTVCSPTRAGLMTGRYQQRFGHEFNPGPDAAATFGLPLDQVTLPQALKSAGYVTGMFGKWHLGHRPELHPTRRGFDEFFGFLAGAHGYNAVGRGTNVLQRGTTPVEQTDYLTDAFAREAAAFVDRHAKESATKPFFLYLPFNAIHSPMQAPAKYLERFADEKDEKRRTMLAMLSALDDGVGAVLAKLREHKLDERTLVMFVSDNGGPTRGNGSRNTPLRGFKGATWEGGVRVPFLMRWPGTLPAGKVYDKPVIALDLMPTVLAAAGVAKPEKVTFDGVDLVPFVKGERGADARPHETLYWRFGQQWAIRDGDLKLTRAERGAPPGLYDLSKDPGEQTDLSAEQPEVAKRLKAKWDAWSKTLPEPAWRDSRDAGGGGGGGGAGQRRAANAATAPAEEE